jgi:hypothetical protein
MTPDSNTVALFSSLKYSINILFDSEESKSCKQNFFSPQLKAPSEEDLARWYRVAKAVEGAHDSQKDDLYHFIAEYFKTSIRSH